MRNLKEVFDQHLGHLIIDSKFYKQVKAFQTYFIGKNDQHVHFFAEPLLGVYALKWTSKETDMWFNDICECDEEELEDDILRLPSINKNFEVSSNPLHLLFLYLIHATERSTSLKEKEKLDCKITLMAILNYKFISSILAHYFRLSLADKALATDTYNNLSKQFEIKQYGSWGKLLIGRAEEIISLNGVYANVIKRFDEDKRVVDMVNDAKSRLNRTVKAIMQVFYRLKDQGSKISSSSSTMVVEDGIMVKDLNRLQSNYIRYIERILPDESSFIKGDLQNVVASSMKALDEQVYAELLVYISQNYLDRKKFSYIQEAVKGLIIYTFELMKQEEMSERDLNRIADRIRQNFMAGRVNDPQLVKLKKSFDKLIHTYNPKTKRMVITNERVALMIYIVLRAMTMRHYND